MNFIHSDLKPLIKVFSTSVHERSWRSGDLMG